MAKSTTSTRGSPNPASSSRSAITPSGAQANWPGASGSGRSTMPRPTSSRIGIDAHGLSAGPVQAASATRPPGRRIRRVSRSAFSASAISM